MYRTESAYRKRYAEGKGWYEDVFSDWKDSAYLDEIKKEKQVLQKEKYKVQTEKLELNRWLREEAREELFFEKVIDAIRSTDTDCSDIEPIKVVKGKKHHALFFADNHFGKEFKIYGLKNEILNEYSPEIFYERMNVLLQETIDYIEKESITHLKVFDLGDSLDGFLRHSQIWTLRFGVVDSAIIYGKFMAEWLKKLSKHVVVEFHKTNGNHGELRLLDGKKDEHLNSNMEDVTSAIIELKNEENPNFSTVKNKTGFIYTDIAGYNLFGMHGEVKDPAQALKDYSDMYGVDIDIIASGHKHHSSLVNCGYRKHSIGVGSVVGSDDFSIRIKRHSDASANIITFEEGKGKVNDYTIILN